MSNKPILSLIPIIYENCMNFRVLKKEILDMSCLKLDGKYSFIHLQAMSNIAMDLPFGIALPPYNAILLFCPSVIAD